MASSVSMPRLLSQRGTALLRLSAARRNPVPSIRNASVRHASSSGNSKGKGGKPLVLEKPDKFRPPSHPARLPRKVPRYQYGGEVSEAQKMAQATKKYPNMMPPEGSFMHWFLTNRILHTYISLTVLMSLAFYVFLQNFLTTTPYADMLPPAREFWAHPFRFIRQYGSVYKMHTEYVSAETAERRRRKLEDIDKRAEYRKAHGLDKEDSGLFGGLFGKKSDEEDSQVQSPVAVESQVQAQVVSEDGQHYTDFEGRKKPLKKWLGIW